MRRFLVVLAVALAALVVPAMALAPRETVLVNRAPDGSHGPVAPGFDVSFDGRCVAFASTAPQLPGANGSAQVYVRDTVANTTTLVSATPGGAGGDGGSTLPAITPDCRYVAFDSEATNLTAATLNQRLVYRRDLQTGTTILVSRANGASGAVADRGRSRRRSPTTATASCSRAPPPTSPPTTATVRCTPTCSCARSTPARRPS